MNILITGGSGFIGRPLSHKLRDSGHSVVITTRRKADSEYEITWTPPELLSSDALSRFDAVINLAGEKIASSLWTKEKKERILLSRIDTTRALVRSMHNALAKPKVLISASAIGYYGPRGDEGVTEDAPPAFDFLAEVCMKWEKEAYKAEKFGVRVVTVRIGGALEADGGALPTMAIPFKFFVGGPIGKGKQWFSWIHRDDVIGIIKYALDNASITGPINATAPHPVRNKDFSTALGIALHRPSSVSVPGFMVKLTLGELGAVLLTGQRVLPEKALSAGYTFKYENIDEALKAIYRRKKI